MTPLAQIETVTSALDETFHLGQIVGRLLRGGSVLGLVGDLGSGKTVFVRGLAAGLAVPDTYYITSPTFTLINEYPGRLPLYHVDLYRLHDTGDAELIGLFDLMAGSGVTAVEWADRIEGQLPEDRLDIHLAIVDDDSRRVSIVGLGREAALVDSLKEKLATGF